MGANTVELAEMPAEIGDALTKSERRLHERLSAAQIRWLKTVRLKYGPVVRVLDVSCGGLQIETVGHPLEPGGTLAIELGRESGTVVVPASVVRCHVSALLPHTVYRGALAFKRLIEVPGEPETAAASADDNSFMLSDAWRFIANPQPAWHKLVLQFLDGRLLKGFAVDFVASSGCIHVLARPDAPAMAAQTIPLLALKAIYFVRDFVGDDQEVSRQCRERRYALITFTDGETLAGVTSDYDERATGFFVRPTDDRHTRVFVLSRAIRALQFL